ncbi:hypothetical protein HX860_03975 [Marine Group I thaumarchaeote]|jgi:hypothetical protein|uniref:Uncharacterized protein n=1 Tax=Marine Group I thaumarchaeote TaxID=2511932 RepID=A0A7K4NZU0_9ARCH|nr:MAG: hypothetical protein DSN69_00295 [Nitrosopumilus sp. YT1]NMI81994.1 hypothetical protein [Candidatus Nitrosopumilus sp. MTA1]NWJ20211.1 hypothetical protein [Marine Group I thaumarchaeote]NWK01038.1 hypothetical protein [Marine Group I thaumarchaeote]NWK07958.1 hypothetical protein [Marine Group I thaumarchaeote]
MTKYGNNAQAGFGMIVVAASLAAVGLIGLMIGEDVLFSDDMQRANTAHFNECKENDFKLDGCEKYWDRINTEISGIFVDLDK